MPTDPTTAEKAERLGLRQGEFSGDWCLPGRVYTAREIDALYAEQFPAPDYRAALEALMEAASAVTLTLANAAAAHGPVEDDQCRALLAALTHARKVLHGQ